MKPVEYVSGLGLVVLGTPHREIQSLVAFELKIDKFRPEYLGQLEFYLEALDRDIKKPHEYPSTALCADLKPRNIFESGASRRFQKYFCTT